MSTTEPALATVIESALYAATRAPSPHNTQPWRFAVDGDRIDVLLDPRRVLTVADRDGREAHLSCGAALFNLRLALRSAGRGVLVDLLPDQHRPDLLATVWIKGRREPNSDERTLASAIGHRSTNRRPFAERPVPAAARHRLVNAADVEGAHLVLLDQPGLLGVFAGPLRRADHMQEQDPAFQAELREWTAERAGRADGVAQSAGGPRPIGGGVLALRHYGESTVERPFEQDPLVAVLTTPRDRVLDQLRAGQAMQRVLLTATDTGLSASFLSQPMEITLTRNALRALIGGREQPQTVLRLGYGYPGPQTPRRGVAAVTTHRATDQEPRP